MKQDCGEGQLIPNSYSIVYCKGKDDKEIVQKYDTIEFALSTYRAQVALLKDIEFSNARLYANCKKGYANCILFWSQKQGEVINRLAEL